MAFNTTAEEDMAKADDIYEQQTALPEDYSWDARGLALAKVAWVGQGSLRVAAVVLAIVAACWYVAESGAFGSVLPLLALELSVIILCLGLAFALASAVRGRLWKAGPSTRHDYSLWLFRRRSGRLPKQAASLLLGMARASLETGRIDGARRALERIDEGQLDQDGLKLFHLLGFVTCLCEDDCKTEDAEELLVRYEAVPRKAWEGFPDPDEARSWLGSEDARADAVAAVSRVRNPRGAHPVHALLLTLIVAHCLAFAALLYGINAEGGWKLRCGYATVGGLFAALFLLVLGIALAIFMWREGPRRHRRGPVGTVLSIVLVVATGILALALSFETFVNGVFAYDGTERVIASGVEDKYSGRTYDYLAVDWQGYDPRDVTTDWWRADSPLLMEKWSDAKEYDKKAVKSPSQTGTTSGTADSGGSASDGGAATSDLSSSADGTDASASTSEARMRTLATYLVDRGIVPKTGVFQIGADAKGNSYASLGTGTDTEDGKAVVVEYRILSNGETNDAQGQPSEEFVLEKWYPEDEGRDPQILGFYLVNESTSAVTDEGRTSW